MTIVVFLTSLLGAMALGTPAAFAFIICELAIMAQIGTADAQVMRAT